MGKWFPMLLGKAKASSQTGGFVVCSDCFTDQGLKLDAGSIGIAESSPCPNCGRTTGRKLGRDHLGVVAHRFFVWGTLHKCDYGAAPVVTFNQHRKTEIDSHLGSRRTYGSSAICLVSVSSITDLDCG